MRLANKSYEIIFVDDGSSDKTFEILKNLHHKNNHIKVVKLRGNWGKSMALQAGFEHTKGDIIFTLDADLQDNPIEIPNFLAKIEQGYDLVTGWKKKRYDPLSKVIPSRIFNFATAKLTGVKVHDTNCGFKAYKRDVVDNLNIYGELYRFIPIIAAKQNYKVAEIEVQHRARKHGKSKYGWERNIKGLLDLITIVFLTGYLRRPGHFFGFFGLISFFAGFIIGLYITYLRLTTGSIQFRHPLLYLGMLLMIIGVQLVTTGLIAELVVHYQEKRSSSSIVSEKLL
jgi:glycosyltransferase involved in cell wall biosynthesis